MHLSAISEKVVELRSSSETMQPQFTCATAWKAYSLAGIQNKYEKSPYTQCLVFKNIFASQKEIQLKQVSLLQTKIITNTDKYGLLLHGTFRFTDQFQRLFIEYIRYLKDSSFGFGLQVLTDGTTNCKKHFSLQK